MSVSSKRKSIFWEESAQLLADEQHRVLWDSHIQTQLEEQERQAEIWPKYEKISISVLLFFLSTLIAGAVTVGIVYTNGEWDKFGVAQWIAHCFGFIPLITFQLFLGIPQARYHLTTWVTNLPNAVQILPASGLVAFSWLLSSVILKRFDPLAFSFVYFMAAAVLGSMKQVQLESAEDGITWSDAAVWLLLWIPLDLRWFQVYLWIGNGSMGYDWWASAMSLLLVVGFGCFRGYNGFGYRLVPHWKDLLIGIAAGVTMWIIVVPIGLGTGFLKWHGFHVIGELLTAQAFLSAFGEIFFTVAITEELFFRAILMNGIHQLYCSRWKRGSKWMALVLSSLAFGLMHWPRVHDLTSKLAYVALAFLAGLLYGSAYLFSGNNILAPAIAHTLTDTFWMFVFP